jgi:aminopeptidase N
MKFQVVLLSKRQFQFERIYPLYAVTVTVFIDIHVDYALWIVDLDISSNICIFVVLRNNYNTSIKMDIAERVLLPPNVCPIHYKIEISPNFDTFEFGGILDIDVIVKSHPTTEIILHSKEINIKHVTFQGLNEKPVDSIGIEYNSELTSVAMKFKNALPIGEGVLHIEYVGILNNSMAGFYRSKYSGADGTTKFMASTQFEALDARRALPCWDEPALKASFSVTMVVPSNMQALSNMPELSSTHLPGNKKRVVFDKTPVMSTYLLAFAVGEFDMLQTVDSHGVCIRVFTPPGRGHQGRYALNVARECLEFYDDFFNNPYPLPKLDMSKCSTTYHTTLLPINIIFFYPSTCVLL